MNKWLYFIVGIIVGLLIALLYSSISKDKVKSEPEPESEEVEEVEERSTIDGVTLFDEPGDIITEKSFKVLQVVANDGALVNAESDYDMYLGPVYLLTNEEGKYYYDDEIIKIPEGKVVRQVGIYRYPTRNDNIKTVAIIQLMDK